MTFTFPSLSYGVYLITYQAQVDSFVKEGTVLSNKAQLIYDGLVVPKITTTNVTMATSYTVHVGVYNEAGELVKEVWVQQLSQEILSFDIFDNPTITSLNGQVFIEYKGTKIATWDGTNASGDPVSNGKYYLKVDNVDSLGVVNSVSQTVTVSRSIAKVQVNIYNEAGEIVRHLYSYMDDPTSNPLSDFQLSSNVIKPSTTAASGNTVSIVSSNGMTLVWDGRSDSGAIVTNGRYQIEVHVTDGKGGEQVITRAVIVESANDPISSGKVYAAPNILTGGTTTTRVKVDSTTPYTLTVQLYDIAGELLKRQTGTAGTNYVDVDVSSLASGLYFIVTDLVNATGGLEGKQTTQIIIQK
jgi:flagellar hook assembly protein FlgD